MEIRVAGHEVLLTLDKNYCSEDDSAVLQSVSKYKALIDYLTKLHTEEFHLSTLVIRNVQYVAHRIVSLTVDSLFAAKNTRDTVVQTITLSDDIAAALLPIAHFGGNKYAVLVNQNRAALGGEDSVELFFGTQGKPGTFTGNHTELLTANGFTLDSVANLGSNEITVGNEGMAPVKFLTISKVFSDAEFEKLQATSSDEAQIVTVLLENVATSVQDAKAAVAAALAQVS